MGPRSVLLGWRHRHGESEGWLAPSSSAGSCGLLRGRRALRPSSREGQEARICRDAVGASSAWVPAFGAVLPQDFWDAEVTFFIHVEKYSFISIGATVNK